MKNPVVFAHRNKEGYVIRLALDAGDIMQLVQEGNKVQLVNDRGQVLLVENTFEDLITAVNVALVDGWAETANTDELCAQPQLHIPEVEIVVPRH